MSGGICSLFFHFQSYMFDNREVWVFSGRAIDQETEVLIDVTTEDPVEENDLVSYAVYSLT